MEDPPLLPPYETVRALSDLYTFQCSQWAPIRNSQIIGRYKEIPLQRKHVDTKGSQLIRKYKEIPVYIRIQIPKADGPPLFETATALSDLYTFQCCQWVPIRNSQIIGRYKEIPVQRKHVGTKGSQLIRKYKEIPVYIRIQIPKADGPPIWNCLMRKWQPRVFIPSMRTHSKQSIIRKYKEIPVYIWIQIPKADGPPQKAHCHDNNSYNFSDFQLYQVTLPIYPPLSLWSKSWKWYTALHSIQLYIYLLSLYELCHLELSKWTGQSCICFYAKFLWFYHVVAVIVHFTTTYICCCCCCCSCCCVLHIRSNNN